MKHLYHAPRRDADDVVRFSHSLINTNFVMSKIYQRPTPIFAEPEIPMLVTVCTAAHRRRLDTILLVNVPMKDKLQARDGRRRAQPVLSADVNENILGISAVQENTTHELPVF